MLNYSVAELRYRTILPIPQKEINANSNIVQTPEYLK